MHNINQWVNSKDAIEVLIKNGRLGRCAKDNKSKYDYKRYKVSTISLEGRSCSLRIKCSPCQDETPPKKIIEATRGTSKGKYRSEEEDEIWRGNRAFTTSITEG